ncbi:hypothetical protein B296_00040989 [Ensete ventricosum]|uniref:Uncharacterized protein n=1 Tax=Ensete ventricosum TaxID=4639 RepID=A0A426ZNH9_ENSVE|nr:hypothetical protein B296_00040989 [Ensete ventricosum]
MRTLYRSLKRYPSHFGDNVVANTATSPPGPIDGGRVDAFLLFLQNFDLHPVTDSMLALSLEGLNLLMVVGSETKVVNREDFEQRGLLLGEVVEVAQDLGPLH